jgi:hypothetical protein
MLANTETITIVHHVEGINTDTYTCTAIVGVSWFGKRGDAPSANAGDAPKMEYKVRIPDALVPDVLPVAGDIIVRGVLGANDNPGSLQGREWFRASYVGDNRRGKYLRHVVVGNR